MPNYLYPSILRNNPILPFTNHLYSRSFDTIPTQSLTLSFSLFRSKIFKNRRHLCSKILSVHQHSSFYTLPKTQFIETLILCVFSLTLLCLRLTSTVLLPDFPRRWHELVSFSEVAEARFSHYPLHLWQAVVAYEDRRFFQHFGIDPVGIGRAVISFSALGGGSTVTQQIYWGHGIYGIEMAANLYFGKHPTLLSLGECAMLAGIIPAPELRSPLRDSSRGKIFQVRVLKRMVEVGFIDIKTALLVARQSLDLRGHGAYHGVGLLLPSYSAAKLYVQGKENQRMALKEIWDWERESKIWEACEDMDRWVLSIQKRSRQYFLV